MRVLVLDRDENFRMLVSQILAIEWPEVDVEDYCSSERALWSSSFKLVEFDALVAGIGNDAASDAMLETLAKRQSCPPRVYCGDLASSDGQSRVQAMGAGCYITRSNLNRQHLARAIRDVQAQHQGRRAVDETKHQAKLGRTGDYTAYAATVVDLGIRGYRTVSEIGQGGMSRVFLATRESDNLELVLKVLDHQLSKDDELLQRFMHEYQIVATVTSPHVVKIYDQGFTDDHVFIAMEYFSAGDLKHLLTEAFVPKRALKLLLDIAMALDAIHQIGIVHRDLKPHNVMFRRDRSMALVDFGVSKLSSHDSKITLDGDILGTPHYMSPEQGQGKVTDQRSDLYSLGVIFYEMLTGQKPFVSNSMMGLLRCHANDPIPALPNSLSVLQRLLNKLMAKDPDERFQSAQELITYIQTRWG